MWGGGVKNCLTNLIQLPLYFKIMAADSMEATWDKARMFSSCQKETSGMANCWMALPPANAAPDAMANVMPRMNFHVSLLLEPAAIGSSLENGSADGERVVGDGPWVELQNAP